jgi:succinate dehydrogenase / fumarate reductase flavoprotein subunit
VLRNNQGTRFMFQDIPPLYRGQTAETEEEGWRYTQGDKTARRPPELLTRDHVARCIVREIREGRGSPHGGVFLDISWIKARIPHAEEHIRRKLPSMYHQFKELAGIDITKEPMEVGPTTHYMMGGVRVDGETQMSTVPGLFAAGECAGGLHGANRLGGNSLSDLLVFGKLAGEHAAGYASEHGGGVAFGPAQEEEIERLSRLALAPLERQDGGPGRDGPYAIQHELQDRMQALVGIVRNDADMRRGLDAVLALKERAARVAVPGNREYNPGWHTAIDLDNLLTVSEAIARAALERKESRGAHFREDYPDKDAGWGRTTLVIRRGAAGEMLLVREPIPDMPPELRQIIEEHT